MLNTARPGESRAHASGESASGESDSRASNKQASEGQMLVLEEASEDQVLALEEASEGQMLTLEEASEGQVLALEQKKEKNITFGFESWCENSERDKWHDGAQITVITCGLSESSANCFIAEPSESEKHDHTNSRDNHRFCL